MQIVKHVAAFALFAAAASMHAGDAGASYCEGRVHGLSGRYNPATGSGFLAVRAGPRTAATQTGELFNGDTVEILGRTGNWYRVAMGGIDGWASARYIRNSCGF